MKWFKAFAVLLLGMLIGALLMPFDFEFINTHINNERDVSLGFAELASIGLTAATVVLGCVALMVGIAAIFGFQSIRAESAKAAEKEINRRFDSLDAKIEAGIAKRLVPYITKIIANAGKGGKFDDAVERAIYGSTNVELGEDFDPDDDEAR